MVRNCCIGVLASLSFAASVHSQNLVVNGGFETGDFSGWTANRNFVVTAGYGVSEGLFALEFAYGNDPGSTLQQQISTVAGSTYTVSFDWKASHPNTNQTLLFSVLDNSSSELLSQIDVSGGYTGTFNAGAPFASFSTTFVAKAGLTNLSFSDTSASSLAADQIIDNVSVSAVPEPEAYAMFIAGLALIGAASKRRKAYQA
jgi:hypothetical protein